MDWLGTSLYRFFDSGGRLLYVGITVLGHKRWSQHRRSAVWWPMVASATVKHYPTRRAAIRAEERAIITERPLYNVMHNEVVAEPAEIPVREFARRMGCGVAPLKRELAGTVPMYKVGRELYVGVADMETWVQAFRVEAMANLRENRKEGSDR